MRDPKYLSMASDSTEIKHYTDRVQLASVARLARISAAISSIVSPQDDHLIVATTGSD